MMPFHPKNPMPWLAAMILASGAFARAADFPADPLGWPAVTATNKPWTRWWWLGSAVDKPNLTRQLADFAQTGLGGVEICPIYGAVGAEDRELQFLSPQWMEMLAHTTTEAKRLGLGVDMTTGTGWPFGGPQVTPDFASASLQIIRQEANGGTRVAITLPKGKIQCLRAFPESGSPVDLSSAIKEGKLDWLPPAGKWNIVGVASDSPIQKVKRAAPGGQGNVLDPFSASAMERYLTAFDKAFENFSAPLPRAQFHDSFEYYAAEWTPVFFEQFLTTRRYDLRDQLPAFAGIGDPDTVSRVRADYRETLSELHLAYLQRWHDWAKARGGITRNQAHGSPGNLLDHYAVSEIPETEIFKHVDENQIPMMRFAASAAHSKGDTLVSAETFTWLDEHFQVTPEKLKDAADFVFLGGVNHIFFHGIPYSPEDAKWPGWLFYASTHMGRNGGLWRDLSAFTGYLQRCQSVLQEGKPDSDVLLYFPFSDTIHGGKEKLPLFTVHNQDAWLWSTPFYKSAMELWESGITFDFTSDAMLKRVTVSDGQIVLGSNTFEALVLPGVKRVPVATMEALARVSAQGGKIVFYETEPPTAFQAPGFLDHQQRTAVLTDLFMKHFANATGNLLGACGVTPEPMRAQGLRFVRRKHEEGHHYFIVNRSAHLFDGNITLARSFKSAVILDPWHAQNSGVVTAKEIPLHLTPGQSILIRTFTDRKIERAAWTAEPANPQTIPVNGSWKIEFIEGGPILPAPADQANLASWTTLPDAAAANFSGTARYTTTFEVFAPLPASCQLDLGKVAHTARVSLNGGALGISWCAPHLIDITKSLKPGMNLLEIEVTNLAANRIADLDRRKVPWKQFHEINFVNIDYKLFDAAGWKPMESGLLGPVRLLVAERK